MSRLLVVLPLLLTAACAMTTGSVPASDRNLYRGISSENDWRLVISRWRIVMNYGVHNDLTWISPRRRSEGDVRVWEAGGGHVDRVRIEARADPCEGPDGNLYADRIRIVRTIDGEPFVATGCGGHLIRSG